MQPTLRLKIKAERCSKKVVKSVKKSISEKFALAEYSLTLVCIKEGCIELFFHISKATMSHMSTFVCVYDCIDVLARQGITCSCLQISNLNFNVPSRSSTMSQEVAQSSDQAEDTSEEYAIQAISQLHFVLENAPLASQFYTKFSWKELESLQIAGVKIMKVETRWFAVVSSLVLNKGYRILAERESDLSTVLLCEGENSPTGKEKVDKYWSNIIAALQYPASPHHIPVFEGREINYYENQQHQISVITRPDSLNSQSYAEFYHTILYGTIRQKGNSTGVNDFYLAGENNCFSLHVGVAQCSIPHHRFVGSTIHAYFNNEKSFVKKLLARKSKAMPTRINYINEMHMSAFKQFYDQGVLNYYDTYLHYLSRKVENMLDALCDEDSSISIRKGLVKDCCSKMKNQLPELNKNETEYFGVLKQLETKLQHLSESKSQDILLYVHGLSNSMEECFLRASQIACDIGFGGRVAVYSWPSIEMLSRFRDNDQLDAAVQTFLDFLEILCESTSFRKLHIIAHSAANLLLTRVTGSQLSQLEGKIGQVICADADVKVEFFKELYRNPEIIPAIDSVADNVTVYYRNCDKVSLCNPFLFHREGPLRVPAAARKRQIDYINIFWVAYEEKHSLATKPQLKYNLYTDNPDIIEDMRAIIIEGHRSHFRSNI